MFGQLLNSVGKFNYCAVTKLAANALPCLSCGQQIRTTFILKRRRAVELTKEGQNPRLRARHFMYDLVEDTNLRKHKEIDVLLTTYVEGFGNRGDLVSVKPNFAYHYLILPGLGAYNTPENIQKYSSDSQLQDSEVHSSPCAEKTAKYLSRLILGVVMNKEISWTLEPWHISMSFRKAGANVPENAITMPKYPIKGPDISLQAKEFLVKVTINGLENAVVRCRIHHWSTSLADRLPFVEHHWRQPAEALFPEEAEIIKSLPPIAPPKAEPSGNQNNLGF